MWPSGRNLPWPWPRRAGGATSASLPWNHGPPVPRSPGRRGRPARPPSRGGPPPALPELRRARRRRRLASRALRLPPGPKPPEPPRGPSLRARAARPFPGRRAPPAGRRAAEGDWSGSSRPLPGTSPQAQGSDRVPDPAPRPAAHRAHLRVRGGRPPAAADPPRWPFRRRAGPIATIPRGLASPAARPSATPSPSTPGSSCFASPRPPTQARSQSASRPHLLLPTCGAGAAAKSVGMTARRRAWSPGTPGDPHGATITCAYKSGDEATTSMIVPDLCVATPTGLRNTTPNPELRVRRSKTSRSTSDSAPLLASPRRLKCRLKSPATNARQPRYRGSACNCRYSASRDCQNCRRTSAP
eukprot:9503896-Pyramimonas_sp.AAC.2